jgi:hypothetical protein
MGAAELEDDDPMWFKCARDGDHLMCQFQCDTCHFFYNLQKRQPGAKSQDEVLLLMCIWWANLDAFWSHESATVQANQCKGNRDQGLMLVWGSTLPILIVAPLT